MTDVTVGNTIQVWLSWCGWVHGVVVSVGEVRLDGTQDIGVCVNVNGAVFTTYARRENVKGV